MKRSRAATLGLKHLAFFEAVGEAEENSSKAHAATAGLLMLRLIDHWILAGPVMVEPESVSVRSVRHAIMQLESKDPSREVLLGLINAMQTVREVDIQPVLPRLFAYAGCLEKRAELTLAADVYGTIARLGEEDFDGDLLIDSFLRLGYLPAHAWVRSTNPRCRIPRPERSQSARRKRRARCVRRSAMRSW